MEGKLVRIYKDLRYGFIRADKQDYFFHQDDFDGDWNCLVSDFDRDIPQFLQFEPIRTEKGLRAKEVVLSDTVV